ncbi:MAG: threonine--tRNA ligase [Actinomycetota bacterium]|nr:threonine--tRNA ligase [Actinomycetota bacterium]MDQ6947152.1 threonine--tRNA ligase [Actinomycetota bacterium]
MEIESVPTAVPDRSGEASERDVDAVATAGDLFPPGSGVIAARIGGQLRDLAAPVRAGDQVEPVTIDSPDGLNILRHSTAHVLAQAVQQLFPGAKLGIGPPIENGFYYDFDVAVPFTAEDLKAIEKRMREIVKQGQRFSRRVSDDESARVEFADQPYKLELIGLKGAARADGDAMVEVGPGELTIYDNLHARTGELCWKDLCRGPHLPTTRTIPAFKVLRSAGAYWRGSEKNPQLQRIYGTAWPSSEAQDRYLAQMAEAERRDHRRLGQELDLFSFPPEIGSGLAVFHPKGGMVRKVLEDHSRRRHEDAGYEFVNTPHITKEQLFQTSGHLGWYAEHMYPPMELEGSRYYLKPMNCPFHILIYRDRGRSYRELPLRLFEFGTVYRYEQSGVVHGLTRVRGLTMDDAHIFCTRDQLTGELQSLLRFVLELLADFGLSDFYLELSTRGAEKEKFAGSDDDWEEATSALRETASDAGLELVMDEGGAAFYGPKISVQARDAIGRTWQMSTIQVDTQLPARFELEFDAPDGTRQRPIMIHRALFGSIERFFGILVEHYAGAFPAWLAPVQVIGIPITERQVEYLDAVASELREARIRVEVDRSDERMQKKIRTAQKSKVPFMILAGDDDQARGTVSFRYRDGSQRNFVPRTDAVAEIVGRVASRDNRDPTAATTLSARP